jgi:hypothetical protein
MPAPGRASDHPACGLRPCQSPAEGRESSRARSSGPLDFVEQWWVMTARLPLPCHRGCTATVDPTSHDRRPAGPPLPRPVASGGGCSWLSPGPCPAVPSSQTSVSGFRPPSTCGARLVRRRHLRAGGVLTGQAEPARALAAGAQLADGAVGVAAGAPASSRSADQERTTRRTGVGVPAGRHQHDGGTVGIAVLLTDWIVVIGLSFTSCVGNAS